jgi:hypothetical protein
MSAKANQINQPVFSQLPCARPLQVQIIVKNYGRSEVNNCGRKPQSSSCRNTLVLPKRSIYRIFRGLCLYSGP